MSNGDPKAGQDGASPSRRAILAGGLALAAAAVEPASAQTAPPGTPPAAPPATPTPPRSRDFDAVARLGQRLCNLRKGDGYGVGVELDRGVLDLSATAERLRLPAPRDVDDLLQNGRGAEVGAILAAIEARPDAAVLLAPANARFAPLVTRPGKILCIGFNYREHAAETNTPIPKAPPIFCKFSTSLNHHGGTVKLPTSLDYQFDYETELVLVFGRECSNASEEDALSYLAGYATGNDLSARQLQTITSQFTAGKAIDGFAPLGPWLGTRQRVADPHKLRLTTRMNGALRQNWTTSDMIYNCNKLIAYASAIMTLKPGDIMFTGTPQGVILGQKIPAVERRWLRPGDEVVSELEGLGELKVTMA